MGDVAVTVVKGPMTTTTHAASIDIARMGSWSPGCKECWWDEGAGPDVGSWFTGRNELPERTWETRGTPSLRLTAAPG